MKLPADSRGGMSENVSQRMSEVEVAVTCFHCGETCNDILWLADRPFCCFGCKTVYEILQANNLCEYYSLDSRPGVSQRDADHASFLYLDEPGIRKRMLHFDSPDFCRVSFFIPVIHCVSCIWLLESLSRLSPGVLKSEVNFGRKTVSIDFDPRKVKLSALAGVLTSVGYTPRINLDTESSKKPAVNRSLVLQLAVAAFCFGNVMLFSFPEYLGIDRTDETLTRVFAWLNLGLSIPVLLFSASGYFYSAINSFRQRQINIDVPIAIGLLALFGRSVYDVITSTGPGYLDSFTGLVFFLLIGRWFQQKTYDSLAFDRDFRSYFPLAVNVVQGNELRPVLLYDLKPGHVVRIRNMEIIPADAVLLDNYAFVDYSFVTGESRPIRVAQGESVYAGGRLIGQPVTLGVEKKTAQSQLTSLWNNDIFRKGRESRYRKRIDRVAKVFTWTVLAISVVTAIVWQVIDPGRMWLVVTSALMVACPCALALAAPFTYGNTLRMFGRHSLYLKNADVVEQLASIDAVIFDKTGTITHGGRPEVTFIGTATDLELAAAKLLTSASTHPLSIMVNKAIDVKSAATMSYFKEIPSKGIQAMIGGRFVQIGSAEFVGYGDDIDDSASRVFLAINDEVRGYFKIRTQVRKNMKGMLDRLGEKSVALLSGDNEAERRAMSALFNPTVQLLFNQDAHDKLAFVQSLQREGKRVLMIGDGLNDSGALRQSDVGLAVTDDTGVFTPGCDGILKGEKMGSLDRFLDLARSATLILKIAFGISFFYNVVALSIAVSGHLTPLAAAVLMPVSSISVVGFSTFAVNHVARKKLGKLPTD